MANDGLSEEAQTLMRALGIPSAVSTLYITLLQTAAVPMNKVGDLVGLPPAAAEQAISYLKLFRLISQDIEYGELVLYAANPRNAWKAHDADFYWMRSQHIGDIESLPALPEMADEERRRRYARLERVCGAIYDANTKAHDPLRHQHRDIHSEQLFASWLAVAVSAAQRTIFAVDRPPRLPDLAPIWVALTRRIRAGVRYTRIVGVDEIVEHGLDIVSRDIQEYNINLRLLPPEYTREAFYLIDNKRLLVKNQRPDVNEHRGEVFGVYTTKPPIVRRFKDRFDKNYMPVSVGAGATIESLRAHADHTRKLLLESGQARDASIFDNVARYGKFARSSIEDRPCLDRLIASKLLVRNENNHIVMIPPTD